MAKLTVEQKARLAELLKIEVALTPEETVELEGLQNLAKE